MTTSQDRKNDTPRNTILFVPLQYTANSTDSTSIFIRTLSHRYDLLGLKQAKWFGTNSNLLRVMRFFAYVFEVWANGLRLRRRVSVFFCVHAWYALAMLPLATVLRCPVIWDVHSGRTDYGSASLGVMEKLQRMLESKIGRFFDALLVRSFEDKTLFVAEGCSPMRITVLLQPADVAFLNLKTQSVLGSSILDLLGDQTCFFMGDRSYLPNRQAAFWINSVLAPAVRGAFPHTRFIVASDGPRPSVVSTNVHFIGHVQDVFALIEMCNVGVIPIVRGNGTLTKLVDMLALGMSCVVTPFVARGVPELVDGSSVMIAHNSEEFISKTLHLLKNPELSERIGTAGRKIIFDKYDWRVNSQLLFNCVFSVLATNKRPR